MQAPDPAEKSAAREADTLPGGFPAAGLTVPRDRVIAGGPPRDGIRSIDAPQFVLPDEARRWVRDEHTVIGVEVGGDARAHPLHVLEHHQVVNDRHGDVGVVVTYDPLVDVARAFLAGEGEARRLFGVSGLVHQSNFLLFDRADESLWQQWDGRSLTGARAGERLQAVSVRVEPLGLWRRRHPHTLVLRPPTDARIDYRQSPYSAYWVSDRIPFPVDHVDRRIHPKELVLGAVYDGVARAYLASVVERRGGRIVDEIGGQKLRIQYDGDSGTFSWEAPAGVDVSSAYWFAWKNFHPDTELWNVTLEHVKPDATATPGGGTNAQP